MPRGEDSTKASSTSPGSAKRDSETLRIQAGATFDKTIYWELAYISTSGPVRPLPVLVSSW
jgi:hypothetical protein